MSKITPQDYIEIQDALGRTGFLAIKELLTAGKTITDVATVYGIEERVVEIVKTTHSYNAYQTISKLEVERQSLQTELVEVKKQETTLKPKTWHYVVAGILLVAILGGVVWGVILLVEWVKGLV